MSRLKLFLLGPPRVELEGVPVEIKRRKGLALLSYLAVTNERQPRETLATLLWSESSHRRARKALRRDLSELNLALAGAWLEADQASVGLRSGFWLDMAQFQSGLAHEATDPQTLMAAVELYRDDFLAGFTLPDCAAFDEWQFFQTESLRQALAFALERLVDLLGDQADYEGAIPYARRWLALDSLHEPAHRQLMQLYAQAGQQAAALRQYEICRQTLAEELGVSPAPETTTLYDDIRTGKLTTTAAISPVPLPPRSSAPRRHNLPTQTTTFIDREGELADIQRLLLDEPDCRLLNLVGPGGIGKTRLALAVATESRDAFPDGAYFVSLTPVGEVEYIVPAMAKALRFTFYGQTDPKDQLLDYLGQKRMLLLIDNFEHLFEGANLLSDILSHAPHVTLLVTSRERLHLQEEWVYEVRGLHFPTVEGETSEVSETSEVLASYSAVELFLQRARQTEANFAPSAADLADIGRICQLVEGMPLGLELAAPWIRTLSCREIAVEIEHSLDFLTTPLRNVPERHRSLQAVFDRSWQLLDSDEQHLFASCSEFWGGFTRASILQVTGTTLPTLAALVDKSLLRREATGRYVIHELARQFARKKHQSLPEAEVQATYQEHAQYFLDLVRRQEPALFGPEPQQAIAIIQADLENVHAAWHWAWSHRETDLMAKALEPLTRFYKMAGLVHTAEQILAATVKQIERTSLSGAHARLYGRVSFYQVEMLYLLAHYEEATTAAEAVYAMGLAEGKPALQARTQILLGLIAYKHGTMEKARQHFERGHALSLQVDDDRLLAYALDNLGNILHILKVSDYGLAQHQQACRIAREQGDRWALATYLSNLGWMHYDKWELEVALNYFQQALGLLQQLNVRYDMIETLLRIGHTYDRLRKDELALEHFQQAVQITEELGLKDVS
jgi:predicted ATPase/DNA-binding SARP family transcriptional activator